jgi:hypothetical protein
MSTPSTTTAPTAAPPTVLKAVLRIDDPSVLESCDKCGSAGLWRIVLTRGELVFCAHDAVAQGFVSRAESHAAYENESRTKGSDHA